MDIGLVDTHCHLSDKAFASDRVATIERALAAGVTHMVAVGGGGSLAESSVASADLAAEYPFLRSTAGLHPHDATSYDDDAERAIEELLARPEVVAVGETGLDYHYMNSPEGAQRDALARHLALAERHRLPVVLHCRDAESDLRDIIAAERPGGLTGVVHCFTGGLEDALWYIERGLVISFTGIITFKKAVELRDVARQLPLDRLMVETDSPYLAPTPYRGKRNEPAYVVHVAEALAELHETTVERVAEATANNARELFFRDL